MAQSIMRSGSERLSSGGAAVNSVRLSLLLACTAVCAAPGLLPVAGFPQVSSSRFHCAMVKRDTEDDWKWKGDKEGAEDFDDLAIAEALSKFGKIGEHLYLQNAPPLNVGTFEEYCNLVHEAMKKMDGPRNARYAWDNDDWSVGYVKNWLREAANDWYAWLLKNTDGDAKDHLKDLAGMDKTKVWGQGGAGEPIQAEHRRAEPGSRL